MLPHLRSFPSLTVQASSLPASPHASAGLDLKPLLLTRLPSFLLFAHLSSGFPRFAGSVPLATSLQSLIRQFLAREHWWDAPLRLAKPTPASFAACIASSSNSLYPLYDFLLLRPSKNPKGLIDFSSSTSSSASPFTHSLSSCNPLFNHPYILVTLKYVNSDSDPSGAAGAKSAISEIIRVSKPSRRVYTSIKSLPFLKKGFGLQILSTSYGILSDVDAKKYGVGGEIICKIF